MRVETVLDGGVDDRRVVLNGRIARKIDGRTFLFAGATGEIPVEIDEELITGGYTLEPGVPVEIRGEVETRLFAGPKIAAHTVSVLLPGGLPTIIYKNETAGRNDPPATR